MHRVLALVVALAAAGIGTPAFAGERNQLGAQSCSSNRTLNNIAERFAWAEAQTWHRGFVIEALENPRLRYNVFNGPSMIAHTHCLADALMTDGKRWTVYYTVEEGMGFASMGTGVEFCVLGLDPWHVYDRDCRTLR